MGDHLQALKQRYLTPGRVPELYDVGDVLGKGGFATVRVGRERAGAQRVVAIKIINPKISADPRQQRVIMDECATMAKVNDIGNGNLLRFIAAHEDFSTTTQSTRLTIVSELCSGGELFDRIVKAGHYDEQAAAQLVATLAVALASLHAARIIHRDIKPENILYASPAPDSPPVIADFGLAKHMDVPEPAPALVGTPGYLSPEIISHRSYTPACDVWALGVITYILLCGYPPFYAEDNKLLYAQISKGGFHFHDEAWSHISESAKDLVRRMLTVDPAQRISLAGMLAHPFLTSAASATASSAHLPSTLANMKKFNARRKIKAAALATAWLGTLRKETTNSLAALMGARVFSEPESSTLTAAFREAAGKAGVIHVAQFKSVMTRLGGGDLPLERMFALFDKDGSGDVDLREFLTALARLRLATDAKAAAAAAAAAPSGAGAQPAAASSGSWRATLRMIFDLYDQDGSGYLSPHELVEMLTAGCGVEMLTNASSSILVASGGDSAGASSMELDEGRAEAIANIFVAMDANQDGAVTFDEFIAAVEANAAIKEAILAPLRGLGASQ